jgi:hypothetical protein
MWGLRRKEEGGGREERRGKLGGGRGKGDRLNVNVIKCHKFFELK